jgi:hypothetical protein
VPKASELLEQAIACQDLARRAQRLAPGLTRDDDRARLIRYSEELLEQAAALIKQAAELPSVSPGLAIGIESMPAIPQERPLTEPPSPPTEPPTKPKGPLDRS